MTENVKVVAPRNMGKGLTYNSTNQQYEVNVSEANGVKVNEDGTVGLAVSPQTGNLLELRSDGVYYGLTAAQSDYYVDSNNGSDSGGDGTEHNPYQTLHKALSEMKSHYSYTIHLQENGSYEWNSANHQEDLSLVIKPYGSTWANVGRAFSAVGYSDDYVAMSDVIIRPKVRFVSGNTMTVDNITYSVARNVNLSGSHTMKLLALSVVVEDPTYPIHSTNSASFDTQGNENGELATLGCDFTLSSSVYVVASVKTQMHYNARIVNSGKFVKLSSYFLNNINFVFDGGLNGTPIGSTGYNYRNNASTTTDLVALVDNCTGTNRSNVWSSNSEFGA